MARQPTLHPALRSITRHGKARYGWNRDLPDARDHLFAAPLSAFPNGLPDAVDLRPHCPPVYDQGQLGSCTGNAIAAALEFDQIKQGLRRFTPSRLFIYFNERAIEGSIPHDDGAQIRDGIKSVAKIGVCPESQWPYHPPKFAAHPPAACYASAKLETALHYARVAQELIQMQGCLAAGYPFVFGFTVYDSFESDAIAKSGMLPMPGVHEKTQGGHAVLAVGYDNRTRMMIVRNSWGPHWGKKGYFMMPYEFIVGSHYASDFWTIRSIGPATDAPPRTDRSPRRR